jgi:putative FmdB family regulatory protein
MPTYSFICDTCNQQSEYMLAVQDRDTLINCPACTTGQLIRTITAVPVRFKGSGFYSTGG